MQKKMFLLLLVTIMLLGGILRTYKYNNPIADWHSWRQVDTAAVARNFTKFGVDPLHPRYDDLSNIQSGKDNLEGWRMVEFPFYQLLGIGVFTVIPGISIELSLRIVSILLSVLSIGLIGLIGKKIGNSIFGLSAAFIFAVLPYNVYYGRAILPENLMVTASLLSLFIALVSKEYLSIKKYTLLFFSAAFAGIALLVKPFAAFILLPLPYVFIQSLGLTWIGVGVSVISFIISTAPLYFWRQWIEQYPSGIPVYTWLFNEGNIRFKGAWFYWLFAERISKMILGYWGGTILVLGIIQKKFTHEGWFLRILLMGNILYFIVAARGNVQHDYYQIPVLIVLSLYLGKGAEYLVKGTKELNRIWSIASVFVIFLFTVGFSWYNIRGFFWINHPEIVEAGKAADLLIPKEAKVIAPYNGDTTFLYQTNRQGWPIGFEIEKKISMGAQYYITVAPSDNDGETKDLASRYTVLERNERYAIIDLTKPRSAQ